MSKLADWLNTHVCSSASFFSPLSLWRKGRRCSLGLFFGVSSVSVLKSQKTHVMVGR